MSKKGSNGAMPSRDPLVVDWDQALENLSRTQTKQATQIWEHERALDRLTAKIDDIHRIVSKQERVNDALLAKIATEAKATLAMLDIVDEART